MSTQSILYRLGILAITIGAWTGGGIVLAGDKEGEREKPPVVVAEAHAKPAFFLGIECFPADAAIRAQLNLPESQGLIVEKVLNKSPAEAAGLKQFDVLLSANDKKLNDVGDLMAVVNAAQDNNVSLRLIRHGKELTLTVKPSKRPAGGDEAPKHKHPMPEFSNSEINAAIAKQMKHLEEMKKEGVDPAKINQLMAELTKAQGGEGGKPLEFHAAAPGILLSGGGIGKINELPDDMSVTITREGKKPAQILVKQGEEHWQVSEKELDTLPEKVRGFVGPLVGRMDMIRFRFNTPNANAKPDIFFKVFPKPEGESKPGETVKGDGGKGDRGKGDKESGEKVKPKEEPRAEGGLKKELDELRKQMQEMRSELKAARSEFRNVNPPAKPEGKVPEKIKPGDQKPKGE